MSIHRSWMLLAVLVVPLSPVNAQPPTKLRVATFNASLNRNKEGDLVRDLSNPDNLQARNVAEIIQQVRPDLLLINEFDYDSDHKGAELFQNNYLSKPQNGKSAIVYRFRYTAEVNTGIASGQDLDGDGTIATKPGARGYGNDALGFGLFPGQYGMVIYSQYPIQTAKVRSFGKLLWRDMPEAMLPKKADGSDWYSPDALAVFRLSSKGHWDVPIEVNGSTLHLLVSHPTPPAFDGPEDRNGKRNHDEIRLWSDYLTGGTKSAYLKAQVNDGDLTPPSTFVILGDLNSDPVDGGSIPGAIQQLLSHPKVNASFVPKSEGGSQAAVEQKGANRDHKGDASTDTADFDERVGNLRADYVLPSKNIEVLGGGVFWPVTSDPRSALIKMKPEAASSDHRLVYLDVKIP